MVYERVREWPCPKCAAKLSVGDTGCTACGWHDTTDGYETALAMIAARWRYQCPALSAEQCHELGVLMLSAWSSGKPLQTVVFGIMNSPLLSHAFGDDTEVMTLILSSAEKLRGHLVRGLWHAHMAQVATRMRKKWHVYSTQSARCDGSCRKHAEGGSGGDGVYEPDEAPTPVLDTHLGCTCVLAPLFEDPSH